MVKSKKNKQGKGTTASIPLVDGCLSCQTYLSEDKRCVVLQVDLARTDGRDGGGPTAERPLTGFLGCWVNSLPAPHTGWQIRTSHPAVVPHMEVPRESKEVENRQGNGVIEDSSAVFLIVFWVKRKLTTLIYKARARRRAPGLCLTQKNINDHLKTVFIFFYQLLWTKNEHKVIFLLF